MEPAGNAVGDIEGRDMKDAMPSPEALVTVASLAKTAGMPRRKLLRRLMSIHDAHGGEWIGRFGGRRIMVNVSLLRATHPNVFHVPGTDRSEWLELTSRVAFLEENALAEKKRAMALSARVRELESVVKSSQCE